MAPLIAYFLVEMRHRTWIPRIEESFLGAGSRNILVGAIVALL